MKKLTFKFRLLTGLIISQFGSQANASLEDFLIDHGVTDRKNQINYDYGDLGESGYQIGNESEDLFSKGCNRLMQLEDKVELNVAEIEEGILLNEMIGEACHNPKEYKMSSIAHKIKEL